MYFYYSRVSTLSQSSKRQIANFKNCSNFNPTNLYVDKVQGNIPFLERPEAIKLYDAITSNSEDCTLVVDSIDRLGRNLINVLSTIEMLTQNNINLKSLKEGFETLINGRENPIAKVVISVMGSIAEMERNRIKERTAEGIKIAKANGKFKGRKNGSIQSDDKLLQRHSLIVQKLKKKLAIRDIADIANCSTTTVIKVKKVMKIRQLL
jgi:DNA invertase Pin-like site-specific DNA recombinase